MGRPYMLLAAAIHNIPSKYNSQLLVANNKSNRSKCKPISLLTGFALIPTNKLTQEILQAMNNTCEA
jgi:hypothetical protein